MNGHVFRCSTEGSDRKEFAKTLENAALYTNVHISEAQDIVSIFTSKDFDMPSIKKPKKRTLTEEEKKDKEEVAFVDALYKEQIRRYTTRLDKQTANQRALYSVMWGQCSPTLQSKIQGASTFKTIHKKCDLSALLKEIRNVSYEIDSSKNVYLVSFSALSKVFSMRQSEENSCATYLKNFEAILSVLEHLGIQLGAEPTLIECAATELGLGPSDTLSDDDLLKCKTTAMDRFQAIVFLYRADTKRYSNLLRDLENLQSRGEDQYPKTIADAYNMLAQYKAPAVGRRPAPNPNGGPTGVSFLQAGATAPGADTDEPIPDNRGLLFIAIRCFHCNRLGHYSSNCPFKFPTDTTATDTTTDNPDTCLLIDTSGTHEPAQSPSNSAEDTSVDHTDDTVQMIFHQTDSDSDSIPSTWVLLDSQSTVNIFKNPAFLTNIRKSPSGHLRVLTNGGVCTSHLVGDLPNFGTVWFNPQSLANILSLRAVRQVCRVTMDTDQEAAILVHRKDGSIMRFLEFHSGLYYFDASKAVSTSSSSSTLGYCFIDTVPANLASFTRREIEGANAAKALYRKLGRPSQAVFEHLLYSNFIRNCPLTADDARRASYIYGPDLASLKGKTTRRSPTHVPDLALVALPPTILEFHREVTLAIDFFFVQGHAFFHTISRKIQFRTTELAPSRGRKTIRGCLSKVIELYHSRGFLISNIHCDNEFRKVEPDFQTIRFNIAAADEHVGEVERSVRTMKERVRSTVHGLPFQRLPKLLLVKIVYAAGKGLNMFPARNGVSRTISPSGIVTGRPYPDYNLLSSELGSYVQVFEHNDPTNTTKERTTGAITLNPTGNAQGGYFFMSLTTGRRLNRRQWTALPMTTDVMQRVNNMGEEEGQPLLQGECPIFEWAPGVPIADDGLEVEYLEENNNNDDDDEEEMPDLLDNYEDSDSDDDSDDDSDEEEDEDQGDDDNNDDDDAIDNDRANNDDGSDDYDRNHNPAEVLDTGDANNNSHNGNEGRAPEADKPDIDEAPRSDTADQRSGGTEGGASTTDEAIDPDISQADSVPAPTHRYNLRSNRQPRYDDFNGNYTSPHQFMQFSNKNEHSVDTYQFIVAMCFTQMSAAKGIKTYGQAAVDALLKEFSQLNDLKVFKSVCASTLSKAEKKSALRAINLIKEKRCGKIKGRSVADGRGQRHLYSREDTTSPTITTEAILITLMIDALEGRDVATADVPGAYLHADMDDLVIMRLTGQIVDIMCDANPSFKQHVVTEGKQKVLYVQLLKALYGCVKSALLWYRLYTEVLKGMGFILNPYDLCVANKEIEGSQCTVAFYVDDNKISHRSQSVVSDIISVIEKRFGGLVVTRGSEHEFLGMDISLPGDKTVHISMKRYINEAIDEYSDRVTRTATTPAKKNLFHIDPKSPKLDREQADRFHSIVAKLLYVSKRARPDIQLAVSFLCTRVSCSTVSDSDKLIRLLQFLKGTADDVLILAADGKKRNRTWIDAAFAVHQDMKSHTGGCQSLGRGVMHSKSGKQKLNTRSSTESEFVGASDYLPFALWTMRFMKAQGLDIGTGPVYQDNESARKLEINGQASAGQRSRHIDIRYYWIKDILAREDIVIEYCPTESMLADFFTKALQGNLFRRLRNVIMGHSHISTLATLVSPKERVGQTDSNDIVENKDNRSMDKGNRFRRSYADVVNSQNIDVATPQKSEHVLRKKSERVGDQNGSK